MRSLFACVSALLLTLTFVDLAFSQPGRPGRPGRGGFDPGAVFDRLAGGQDVLIRSQMSELGQRMLDRMGVKSERITRQQFTQAFGKMSQQMRGGRPGSASAGGESGDASDDARGGGSSGRRDDNRQRNRRGRDDDDDRRRSRGDDDDNDERREAQRDFRRRDDNRDGVLNSDEMGGSLRRSRREWDRNRNGNIELGEYTAYHLDREEREDRQREDRYRRYIREREREREREADAARPDVYYFGNLPDDLPDWFVEYDTDRDGQVGLYEWLDEGENPSEFEKMDPNADGLLTPREMLRYLESQEEEEEEEEDDRRRDD